MYSLCRNIRSNYYLKTKDMQVRLISCLPDSNRNSTGEFFRLSGNWFADVLPYPFSPRDVGRYQELSFTWSWHLLISCSRIELISLFCWSVVESKRFQPDLRVVHVRELNFVLRSEVFVHTDGQHRASHLILNIGPVYLTWKAFS